MLDNTTVKDVLPSISAVEKARQRSDRSPYIQYPVQKIEVALGEDESREYVDGKRSGEKMVKEKMIQGCIRAKRTTGK
jgi:hypothetical protein